MPIETQDTDKGFNRIVDEFTNAAAGKPYVVAGLLVGKGAEENHEDGTPLVVAAAANEFGTDHAGRGGTVEIPPRPAFRTAFDLNQKKYARIEEAERQRFIRNQTTIEGILETIGFEMAADIVEAIKLWLYPPNAPATIAAKGYNKPLTHTGLTAARVAHVVRDRFSDTPESEGGSQRA